ncbi:hypothetical protein B0J11DRAFT_298098 [Dendryphion nanum]|uniref:Uncharacterized protein n=1 Tax=Dendryphion nanum TaxID=256645 RepID=A0A9P9DSU1_9PLEO|nr:hypothetical protein B0J11DRAFT_298098 [Dendryphion nanum]
MTTDELEEVADAIVFMWTPKDYTNSKFGNSWGVISGSEDAWGWFHHFKQSDYPSLPGEHIDWGRYGLYFPHIALHDEFHQFFAGGYRQTTQAQQYRTNFLFTTTLVHEIAHAY